MTPCQWATIHKLKLCTPLGNDLLHIVCVQIFRGLARSDYFFLEAVERQLMLAKLVNLILESSVPTVVIGNIGLCAGSILKAHPEYAAQIEFLQSQDQNLWFLQTKTP